jgi:hypothetical protein
MSLKSGKNSGQYVQTGAVCLFVMISRWIALRMRNTSDESCIGQSKRTIYVQFAPPPPEDRAAYEIMWKKCGRVGQTTDDSTTRRMRITCWITQARGTNWECVTIFILSPTVVTRTRHNITLPVHCLSLFLVFLAVKVLFSVASCVIMSVLGRTDWLTGWLAGWLTD